MYLLAFLFNYWFSAFQELGIAATKGGNECYCAHLTYDTGVLKAKKETNADNCNMKCVGDDSTICGGEKTLSVYYKQ